MKNTASGARESVSRAIIFKNNEHEKFYQEYGRYFWEAIKIRYPEYCLYTEGEDAHVKS